MYQLHIANKNYSSWSLRPWVLMKELNIPFQEVMHPFGIEDDWDNYTKLNPSGLVPCILNEDEIIWDSLAIIEYLAEEHRGIWPTDRSARNWARCATSEMHSGFIELRNMCSMNCGLRIKLKDISPSLQTDIDRIDNLWQTGLERFGGSFLAGREFTAVDAFFTPIAFRFQTYSIPLSFQSEKYMQKILSMTSMQQWYEKALNESYRDAEHESESIACGEVTADLRNT